MRRLIGKTKNFIGALTYLRKKHFNNISVQPVVAELEARKIPITHKIASIEMLSKWYIRLLQIMKKSKLAKPEEINLVDDSADVKIEQPDHEGEQYGEISDEQASG